MLYALLVPCHYFVIYRIYVTLHFLPIFAVAVVVVVVVVVLMTNFHCFSVFCLFLIRYHLERLCKMCLIIVYMWTLWFYSDFIKTIYNKITYQKHSIMNLVGTSSKMKKKYSEKNIIWKNLTTMIYDNLFWNFDIGIVEIT